MVLRAALTALIAAAVLAAPAAAQTDQPPAPKPNVVFVLVDDMSSDLLPYMPNVRKLQVDGTSFSRYVVSDSLCCPSRSSIYTGQLPHNRATTAAATASRSRPPATARR